MAPVSMVVQASKAASFCCLDDGGGFLEEDVSFWVDEEVGALGWCGGAEDCFAVPDPPDGPDGGGGGGGCLG